MSSGMPWQSVDPGTISGKCASKAAVDSGGLVYGFRDLGFMGLGYQDVQNEPWTFSGLGVKASQLIMKCYAGFYRIRIREPQKGCP